MRPRFDEETKVSCIIFEIGFISFPSGKINREDRIYSRSLEHEPSKPYK